jgi:multidrug efflux pump subunit AcrB
VREIADSYRAGKRELELRVTPEAESAGLSQTALARQVRQAFYGEEVQRIQRGRDEVKVMVRFPEADRRSIADLERMRVRGAGGIEIPMSTAAVIEPSRGPATILRTDRRRVINVTADVDLAVGNPNTILADLERSVLPRLLADYPSVRYSLVGEQEQQRETLQGLGRGFAIALFVIYGLLAIPFRSYIQPMIIMAAIPFGLIGAVWGHAIMGQNLAIMSVFGIVALTGVVINDSLVLVDFINRRHEEGASLREAIRLGGAARFRAILLTSLTTFAGLTPLLLERSVQAQFLVPMAISLAFGVLFATVITLLLVPALFSIVEDLRELLPSAS